jgi:hypothetical protein
MCVFLTVKLSDEDSSRIDEIATASSLSDGLTVTPIRGLFQKRTSILHIFEPKQGCTCSFLTDNAYQDDDTWDIRPQVLLQLASALQALRSQTTNGFSIDLQWVGDKTTEEKQITAEEMTKIIRDNRLSPQVKYLVA